MCVVFLSFCLPLHLSINKVISIYNKVLTLQTTIRYESKYKRIDG